MSTMLLSFETLLCLITVTVTVWWYLTRNYNYWSSKGIPGPKPVAIFGNTKDIIIGRHNLGTFLEKIYNNYANEPLVGIYASSQPVLIVNDVDIIKDIMIKNFSVFADRGAQITEKHDPLNVHLFNLEPKRWRPLRAKLSPVFTSGKLREMFYLLLQCADDWEKQLEKIDHNCVDIRDVTSRFTTDVIGVCAFGLQANSMSDENSIFRKMGMRIFGPSLRNSLKTKLRSIMPKLYEWFFGYFLRDRILSNFIIGLTRDTMEYRKKTKIRRHDFVDLLLTIKEQGNIDQIELTDEFLAAQLFVFFAAGFETSSTTISNALYELAMNNVMQEKLRQEILEQLETNEGKITYDGVKGMPYLDKVFKETLRKYPPVPQLVRKSVAPYKFPNTDLTIPADTKVWIPIFAIQRDPKYYPKPELFDPERFSEEAVRARPDMANLPFGDGPRNCIGARFGTMQAKIGIITILKNYDVEVCDKTDLKYEIDTRAQLLAPKNGIFLALRKRRS